MEDIINKTVDTLRCGGTVLYPTDTIWGIGCDARNAEAVERLYAIKERDHAKSMLVLVADNRNILNDLNDLNNPITPTTPVERPTTYIMPEAMWRPLLGDAVADNLPAADGTLGIRVPQHVFCQEVMRRLGAPLVSTSANLSGRPSPANYDDIEKALFERVDYCVPPLAAFLSGESRGSRIVKVEADGTLNVLRP